MRVDAHRLIEIAHFLKHHAEIERRFRMIALQLDRLAIGAGRAGMVAQILPRKAKVEPDRRRRFGLRGALQKAQSERRLTVLPCEMPHPRGGFR